VTPEAPAEPSTAETPEGPYAGQVVAITGSSRGLGRFLAERFLEQGATVFGCSRQAKVDPENPLPEHGRYHHHTVDVTQEDEAVRWLRSLAREARRLDILVNNAGIASMNHSLLTPARTARRLLEVNMVGAFVCCREAAKIMQRRRYGRILNFTSVAVPLLLEGEALYAASKAALETFTKVLAREVGTYGITCNAIGPSPIPTDLIRGVPADRLEALVERLAIRRMGTPEDLWHAVDFFASPAAEYFTGQVLYLGGPS
jgi:3-oxoacyl-[acyl-carrier protein] reductase